MDIIKEAINSEKEYHQGRASAIMAKLQFATAVRELIAHDEAAGFTRAEILDSIIDRFFSDDEYEAYQKTYTFHKSGQLQASRTLELINDNEGE